MRWISQLKIVAASACLLLGAVWPAHAQLSEEASNPAVRSALRAYESGQFSAAQRQFAALAKKGLPVAQFNLAMMHLRDEINPAKAKSNREAERLLLAAAGKGFVRAEHALAQFYDLGLGGKQDLARSFKWTALAAEHGHPEAQIDYATAFYLGRGTAMNKAEAAKWFRVVAQSGDEGAQYLLASMYETGDGVAQDLRLALYWYQIAAQNGDLAARYKAAEVEKKLQREAAPDAPAPTQPAAPALKPV
jgi:uncharacterized protein